MSTALHAVFSDVVSLAATPHEGFENSLLWDDPCAEETPERHEEFPCQRHKANHTQSCPPSPTPALIPL